MVNSMQKSEQTSTVTVDASPGETGESEETYTMPVVKPFSKDTELLGTYRCDGLYARHILDRRGVEVLAVAGPMFEDFVVFGPCQQDGHLTFHHDDYSAFFIETKAGKALVLRYTTWNRGFVLIRDEVRYEATAAKAICPPELIRDAVEFRDAVEPLLKEGAKACVVEVGHHKYLRLMKGDEIVFDAYDEYSEDGY